VLNSNQAYLDTHLALVTQVKLSHCISLQSTEASVTVTSCSWKEIHYFLNSCFVIFNNLVAYIPVQ